MIKYSNNISFTITYNRFTLIFLLIEVITMLQITLQNARVYYNK